MAKATSHYGYPIPRQRVVSAAVRKQDSWPFEDYVLYVLDCGHRVASEPMASGGFHKKMLCSSCADVIRKVLAALE